MTHRGAVGGFWLREHRTDRGRTTRPAGPLVEISLEQTEHDDGALDEELVLFTTIGATGPLGLTSGEARRMAALLTGAADRIDGL